MITDWDTLISLGRELNIETRVRTLRDRAVSDLCAVAFLGEFSRGKSSLINALVERPLLPVDVRPTTIGVVSLCHGERESACLHSKGGALPVPLNRETLRHIQSPETGGLASPESGWLEAVLPLPARLTRFRLLDTPGVNDLGETSPALIYRLLPHVDIVVYVLDASAGLCHSEQVFIKEQSGNGVPSIVFVSKVDRIDTDDPIEMEEVKDEFRSRLQAIIGNGTTVVFGTVSGPLDQLVDQLTAGAEKALNVRRAKLFSIANRLLQDHVASEVHLQQVEEQQGIVALERLSESGPSLREGMRRFRVHVRHSAEMPLGHMVKRSLMCWQEQTVRELISQASMYSDLRAFGERGITRSLEKLVRTWAETHNPHIRLFLTRHARAAAEEARRLFHHDGLRISVDSVLFSLAPQEDTQILLTAGEDGGVIARYGIAAVGSLAAGLIAAPLSVIGFAAGLAFAENLRRQKENALREEIFRAIPGLVLQAAGRLESEVHSQVRLHLDRLDAALDRALESRLTRINQELSLTRSTEAERTARHQLRREFLAHASRCLNG